MAFNLGKFLDDTVKYGLGNNKPVKKQTPAPASTAQAVKKVQPKFDLGKTISNVAGNVGNFAWKNIIEPTVNPSARIYDQMDADLTRVKQNADNQFKAGKINVQKYNDINNKLSQSRSKIAGTAGQTENIARTITSPVRNVAQGIIQSVPKTAGSVVELAGNIGQWASPSGNTENFFKGVSKTGQNIGTSTSKITTGLLQTQNDNQVVKDIGQSGGELLADIATGKIVLKGIGALRYADDASRLQKLAKASSAVSNLVSGKYATRVFNDTYNTAKQAGKSDTQAGITATTNAVIQGLIERVSGVSKYLNGPTGGIIKTAITNAVKEGSEEGLQQLTDNIAKMTINPPTSIRDFTDKLGANVGSSFGYGALMGGMASGGTSRADSNITRPKASDIEGGTSESRLVSKLPITKTVGKVPIVGDVANYAILEAKANSMMDSDIAKLQDYKSYTSPYSTKPKSEQNYVKKMINSIGGEKNIPKVIGITLGRRSGGTHRYVDFEKPSIIDNINKKGMGLSIKDVSKEVPAITPEVGKTQTLYHATPTSNIESINKNGLSPSKKGVMGSGIYFTKNPDTAKSYVTSMKKTNSSIVETTLSPDAKIYEFDTHKPYMDLDEIGKQIKDMTHKENMKELLVKNGYDGVTMNGDSTAIYNKNVITQKSTPQPKQEVPAVITKVNEPNFYMQGDAQSAAKYLKGKKLQEYFKNKSEVPAVTPTKRVYSPDDPNYWATPIKGEPKGKMPNVKDTNGLQPKEGDVIEFPSVLGQNGEKGRTKITWQEPTIANASGQRIEGKWIGNGELRADNPIPFTIVERNGKPVTPTKPTTEVPIVGKKLTKTVSPKASQTAPKARGFVESVQQSQNVDKAVKKSVEGLYTPKTNDTLMGEAKGLLNEGVEIDFKGVKDLDKKVAATMQEAMNQQAKGNHQAAADLYNNLSEKGTELGRGVQAFNLLENMSPEAVSLSVAGKIKKYNRLNPTKKIPELTGDQAKMIADKITAADLLKGRDRNIALRELEQTLNEFIPSTFADKAITVWKAGLLTSLRTHARNFVGNSIHGIAEIAKDVPASLADIAMKGKTGQRTLTFTTKGIREFASKSTRQQMKDIISKGYDPSQIIDKFDYKKTTWAKTKPQQALKKYTDFVFNTLGAEDKPFYNSAMARSLYDQASAAAINAGKKGDKAFIDNLVKNPTDDMFKTAVGDANVAVFKDKNSANKVVSGLKNALGKTEAGKVIGEVTMPFTGVPTSILGQIQAYSPIGLVKGIYKSGKVLSGKVPELQRKAAQELGRGTIGTGIFGLGAYLAGKGLITGQPKDAEEAKQWELQNKPRNSIMIGGKWRSLNSIGPEAVVFLAGAKLTEELGKEEGSIANYATTLGKDYLDQSFVQGLQSPVNALTDPARYGKSYLGQTISSVEPNIVKDLAKATDKSQREMNTVTDYVKGNIPGVRNTMLAKRDVLGNELKQEPTGVGAFVDLFNSKTPVSNTVVNELDRLYKAGQSATPSKMNKSQTIGGEKVTLTPAQLDKLEASSGKAVSEQMNQLMNTPEYQSATDEIKKKTLDNLVEDIRKSAKNATATGTTLTVTKASKKAQLELAKSAFDASGENYQIVGDTVLRRSADGTITATPKIKFESQVRKQQLESLKDNEDVSNWLVTAEQEAKSLIQQLQDPSIDPLDQITIQNDLRDLMSNISKYQSYGGFTKPKASTNKETNVPTKTSLSFGDTMSNYSDVSGKLRKLLQNASTIKRKAIK
jgi:hypothetical protein